MQEHYTLVQAARLIGVTPRILVAWLKDAGISTRKGVKAAGEDARAQYVTRAQIETLALAHRRALPDDTALAALARQLQALQGELEAIKKRLARLEQQNITRPSRPAPAPLQSHTGAFLSGSAADLADTLKRPRVQGSQGGISKAEAARLVSERHGVLFVTARQWPWPPDALTSAEAAEQWAIDYVAAIAPHKRPRGWH